MDLLARVGSNEFAVLMNPVERPFGPCFPMRALLRRTQFQTLLFTFFDAAFEASKASR